MTSATPDPAPSRRERRRREIHERILAAATGLMAFKGFTAITALEIAESADVAEKTFYNHFPSKQHLIEELAIRALGVTKQLLADLCDGPGCMADRFRRFCERSADVAEQSREFTREVILELMRMVYVPGVALAHHSQLTDAIRAFFEQGRAHGDLPPDRDVAFLSEIGGAAYFGIVMNWVTVPDYPLRERLRQLADIAEELLANGAGSSRDEARR
jgi:AcrR family transcriptional regulator